MQFESDREAVEPIVWTSAASWEVADISITLSKDVRASGKDRYIDRASLVVNLFEAKEVPALRGWRFIWKGRACQHGQSRTDAQNPRQNIVHVVPF